jgi:stearoyl-CoA desaturase (delta-9 desaturase)
MEKVIMKAQHLRLISIAECFFFPLFLLGWIALHFELSWLIPLWAMGVFYGTHLAVFTHRAWTHRAWKPIRPLNLLALFINTIAMGGDAAGWAANHRKHHRFSDEPDDPHSPFYKHPFKVVFFPYGNVDKTYASDLYKDPDQLWFSTHYWHINIAWYVLLGCISVTLLGFWIAVQGLHRFELRLGNVLNHSDKVNRRSSNRPLWAFVWLHGGYWHDNHHRDPNNYRFGTKWWHVDLGSYVVWLLVRLGLGKARR